jgi:uncharacterized membrane protein YgcG
MRRIYTLLAFLVFCASASAQNTATVKGKLTDSASKQSLKDATITILEAGDSTLEVFGLAKADGSFSISNISFGDKLLQIRFQGYEPISRKINFSKAKTEVDLGTIYLKQASNDLGNVTVTQSVVQMKKDTIEFAASGFKTKPNAVAEDLLKKIPGMEVGKDGTVKSGGENVQRILVNGKRFFGDDPKLATRNLPPDVIDKIQVFDDMSDQSKFSGFDDGNRVKTINITTKKDVRKGYFGRAVLGVGSEGRYEESANFTQMNGDRQISLTGQANNVNKQSFTGSDIFSGGNRGGGGLNMITIGGGRGGAANFGGGGGSGGGSGITTTLAGGINYRDVWGKNTDAYGSYFYSKPRTVVEQKSYVENTVTPDSLTANDQLSSSITQNESHRINFNMESRFDSMNSLIFRPNVTIQNSSPSSASSTITTGVVPEKGGSSLIYESSNINSRRSSGYSINGANTQFRHRFAKRGRTLSVDLNFSASRNQGEGFSYSINSFYQPTVSRDTINQFFVDSSRSFTINPSVSYTEPIGKNQVIELRYTFNHTDNSSINNTYRYDNVSGKFSRFDSLFSNSYEYTSTSSNANLSYRIQGTKFNLNVGSGLQFMSILSNNTTKNVIVDRDFVNFTPTANFTYNFTRTKSLRAFYNGRTGQPSTAQLQPIVTTSDSINFQVGNPNLSPQFTHSLRLLYNSFDPFTQRIIFATVNGSFVANDIQNSVYQSARGGKTTTYVNLGGTVNLSGYFNYGFPIKSPKSNLNLQTNINYSQAQSLLTNQVYTNASSYTRSTVLSQTVRWTTNLKNNFDMNLSATYSLNPVRNTLTPQQNTNYTTFTLGADFTLYSNNGWTITSDIDLTKYGNRAAGYNTTVLLVTPAIAKQFLKNKAGELRLSCFDVFKQNTAISSSAVGTQLINTQTNTLTRYFMFTFTYNLRNMAAQQQQQQRNMQNMPPGMMRFNGQGGNFNGGGGNSGGGGRRGNN